VPGLMRDLTIKEEGFLSAISKAFGTGDVELGVPEFDRRYSIYGRSANIIRSFLNGRRRTVIDRFFTTHRGTVLKDATLSWSTRGRIRNASQMIATVEDMLTVALALAAEEVVPAVGPDATFDELAPIDPAPVADVAPEPEPVREPEPATDTGPELAAEAEPEPEPEPAPVAVSPPPASAVELDEFCAVMFRPGTMSFEASKTFEQQFKGEQVAWSGVLQSVEPYSYDFVFGAGKGVKATLVIHEVEGGFIGKGEVKAVLQLPASTAGLEGRIGEQVAFAGTLAKVDGLMRKVFVADGRASV
jgi:hypothetical protein